MLQKTLMLALVVALATPLVVSPGNAHSPVLPTTCSPSDTQNPHHYAAGASLDTQPVDWRTTVQLFDSCYSNPAPLAGDIDPDYGVGGGWLPTDHHGRIDNVTGNWEADICVVDDLTTLVNVYYPVHFLVGVVDGFGNLQIVADGANCVHVSEPASYFPGYPSPSSDGGVWVFIENHQDHLVGTQSRVDASAPTTGHIRTIP